MLQNKIKIFCLYLVLGAGGLWHVLNVFQEVMRALASPIMICLGAWLFYECWCLSPEEKRLKFSLWSISVIICGWTVEWFGVRSGWIFGSYIYGETLRPLLVGVPISIGFAWFVMLITSTAVVQTIAPKSVWENRLWLTCFVPLLMVCFDLLMEPAAVRLDYWRWENNHIPIQNYLAWFGLSFFFTFISSQIGMFRQRLPVLTFHAYFAQLAYFALAGLKSL